MDDAICSFPTCGRRSKARGLCSGHYEQQRRTKNLRPLSRHLLTDIKFQEWFWEQFHRTEGCLVWTKKTYQGYGRIWFDGKHTGTHRIAWVLTNGPIPDNLRVLHHCDNPPCGEPSHLWLGTDADNRDDCMTKNRQARGERMGSARLTAEQVLDIRAKSAAGQSQRSLAQEYEVSRGCVKWILAGLTWKHI